MHILESDGRVLVPPGRDSYLINDRIGIFSPHSREKGIYFSHPDMSPSWDLLFRDHFGSMEISPTEASQLRVLRVTHSFPIRFILDQLSSSIVSLSAVLSLAESEIEQGCDRLERAGRLNLFFK